jgi:hypothetical protein
MTRRKFLSLFQLIPSLFIFGTPGPGKPKTPAKQMGKVSGQLSPEGYGILEVIYPIPYPAGTEPFFFACPTGQGSLNVARFEANGLDYSVASLAVMGTPDATVSFTWEAFLA